MDEKEKKQKEEEATEAAEQAAAREAEDAGAQKKKESKYLTKVQEAASAIKAENEKREGFLKREENLMDRKEALNALGGGSPAGTESFKPKFTDEEKASRARIKAVADVNNSAWGKKYE